MHLAAAFFKSLQCLDPYVRFCIFLLLASERGDWKTELAGDVYTYGRRSALDIYAQRVRLLFAVTLLGKAACCPFRWLCVCSSGEHTAFAVSAQNAR